MFHPEGEFNIVGAVLSGVNAVVTLGDEAFPEFAFEGFVALLQDVPQASPVAGCVRATGGFNEIADAGGRASHAPVHRQDNAVVGDGFVQFLVHFDAFDGGDHVHEALALNIGFGGVVGQVVEQDQSAPAEVVPAFEGFGVGPFPGELAKDIKGGFEFVADAQWLQLAVEHGTGGVVYPRAPAVVFAFDAPVSGLGQCLGQRTAIDRAGRIKRRRGGATTGHPMIGSKGNLCGRARSDHVFV